jgi:hypothetical protein
MLFRKRVETVAHVVELLYFVQDRVRMRGAYRFLEILTEEPKER